MLESEALRHNISSPTLRRVRVLDPLVAEKIAAGEVIERPASVVKELVENSLDAGATEVSVALENGGKELIEITDNGSGILAEDLPICVQRHATSKLQSVDDLERISTLGFRGEALPSIGAVSDLTLLSRAKGQDTAYQLRVLPGGASSTAEAVTFGHFVSSPHGTRLQARGLFSQIPARLKFLKSQGAEVAQVREWIERLALAHPSVGFRLISDTRSILSLRPQEEAARVRAILSDGDNYPIVSASSDLGLKDPNQGVIQVRAHWLQGLSSPQTRRIVQVVNGRSVRDRMLQQAILAAFKQALLPGQFPAVAVFVDVDPSEIDVNVHPTKTEVRFLDSRKVFRAVESLISSMIVERGAPAYVPTSRPAGQNSVDSFPWRAMENQASNPSSSNSSFGSWTPPARSSSNWSATPSWTPSAPASHQGFDFNATPTYTQESVPSEPGASSSAFADSRPEAAPAPIPSAVSPLVTLGLTSDRFVGTIMNTYLIYDLGAEMVLIDQHAAHERVRFERLKKRALRISQSAGGECAGSQSLLIPEAVRFNAEERPLIESRLPWLLALGFEAEVFGEESLLFRAVPGEWGTRELRTRLKNLVERLVSIEAKDTFTQTLDEALFEKLASEACHSAIRAGDRLERIEALELMTQLFDCEHPWNCPHGRPTVVRVPEGKIEEWFQRRV